MAHLTETLPPALTPRDRAAIVAQVRALVDGLDTEASDPTVISFPTPDYDADADRFELTPKG